MPLPLVPRCELRYRRVPSGLNAGPVISEPLWPLTEEGGNLTHSVHPGDEADLHVAAVLSDEQVAGCRVGGELSTPVSGAPDSVAASYRMVSCWVSSASSYTRLSPLVVKNSDRPWIQVPSPPLNAVVVDWQSGAVADVATHVTAVPVTRATSRTPADRLPGVVGVNRYRRPVGSSSVTRQPSGDRIDRDGLVVERPEHRPNRALARSQRVALVDLTTAPFSSQLSHVPHGVGPPAQFRDVPLENRYTPFVLPATSKEIAPTPPAPEPSSEFDTYTQPPPLVGKQAPPSGAPCQV